MDYGFQKYQQEFEEKALSVLRSGWYVLGNEVKTFEERFAEYTGASYCVGLASGLDALWIGCKMLGIGPGDEVIVQANTYIASVMGISMNGATPIFTEPDEYFQIDADKIEEKNTEKTGNHNNHFLWSCNVLIFSRYTRHRRLSWNSAGVLRNCLRLCFILRSVQ